MRRDSEQQCCYAGNAESIHDRVLDQANKNEFAVSPVQ